MRRLTGCGNLFEVERCEQQDDPGPRRCPSRELLDRIGDKWSVLVFGELTDRAPHRFAQIRDRIGGISEKMLTQTLRHLEEDGLISRQVFAEVPPRVEYQLTPLGHTLQGPMRVLRDWSIEHAEDVQEARTRYAGRG